MSKKTSANIGVSSGMGFCSVLTTIFVVLKLVGVINWSWIWVLSPLWLPFVAGFAILLVVILIILVLAILGAFVE